MTSLYLFFDLFIWLKLICSIEVINTGGDKYDSISVLKLRLKKQVERYIYVKKEVITNIKWTYIDAGFIIIKTLGTLILYILSKQRIWFMYK